MFEEKKFLDQEGLKYLWSKISMEDYPNNETLVAVLNAIDATFLDYYTKEEILEKLNSQNIQHNSYILSDLLENYILNIDYDTTLSFDTSEIVFNIENTTSILGQAILGKMILA